MIIYPRGNYSKSLLRRMRLETAHYPLFGNTDEVYYSSTSRAYAVDVTFIHDANRTREELIAHGPSATSRITIARRAGGGHGINREGGGVTGYMDPGRNKGLFDPVDYTVRKELAEECNLTEAELDEIVFRAGFLSVHPRSNNPEEPIIMANVLALPGDERQFNTNLAELSGCNWYDLSAVQNGEVENLKPGYLEITLPSSLGSIGIGAH